MSALGAWCSCLLAILAIALLTADMAMGLPVFVKSIVITTVRVLAYHAVYLEKRLKMQGLRKALSRFADRNSRSATMRQTAALQSGPHRLHP